MDRIEKFFNRIEESVSPFHTVNTIEKELTENGFKRISEDEKYILENNGSYYIRLFDSSLIAFTIGKNGIRKKGIGKNSVGGLRITCSHTDFPGLKIKPNPVMKSGKKPKYVQLNTEVYGGVILNTWLDRPLSMAGRVVLRGENVFEPGVEYLNFDRPVLYIPNLAIHMNREVNKGIELNKQRDMMPLCNITNEEIDDDYLIKLMVDEINGKKESGEVEISAEDVLDFEMHVYAYEKPCLVGFENNMISAPRLDNLTSVFAQLEAIISSKKELNREYGLNVACFFDNEEIGSGTKQGADSLVLNHILDRIYKSMDCDSEEKYIDILNGLLLSVDVAHADHPNHKEKADVTNTVILNGGVVIKKAASQSYANDAISVGIVKELCGRNEILCQEFVNRSDMPGGRTLGSMISAKLGIRTQDIGVPILAMHSAREIMGADDQKRLEKLLTSYYS